MGRPVFRKASSSSSVVSRTTRSIGGRPNALQPRDLARRAPTQRQIQARAPLRPTGRCTRMSHPEGQSERHDESRLGSRANGWGMKRQRRCDAPALAIGKADGFARDSRSCSARAGAPGDRRRRCGRRGPGPADSRASGSGRQVRRVAEALHEAESLASGLRRERRDPGRIAAPIHRCLRRSTTRRGLRNSPKPPIHRRDPPARPKRRGRSAVADARRCRVAPSPRAAGSAGGRGCRPRRST